MKPLEWEPAGPYRAVFTSRCGGVSEGPYATLNLGRRSGDDPARVDENRRRACDAIGAEADRLALNLQRHTARVNRAGAGVRGAVVGDGLWTDEPGLPVMALTADCVPIALARSNGARPALAVLHAGRMGLLEGVIAAGAAAVGGSMQAAVGPAIGPCCYEVGEEIAAAYAARFGPSIVREGRRLDLPTAAERLLREAGCARIERFDLCTACNPDLFFSYRRDGKPHGGQGVIAVVA